MDSKGKVPRIFFFISRNYNHKNYRLVHKLPFRTQKWIRFSCIELTGVTNILYTWNELIIFIEGNLKCSYISCMQFYIYSSNDVNYTFSCRIHLLSCQFKRSYSHSKFKPNDILFNQFHIYSYFRQHERKISKSKINQCFTAQDILWVLSSVCIMHDDKMYASLHSWFTINQKPCWATNMSSCKSPFWPIACPRTLQK